MKKRPNNIDAQKALEEHKRKAREIASAKRSRMKALGLKSVSAWLDDREINYLSDYKNIHNLPTLSDALSQLVKHSILTSHNNQVYLDSASQKIVTEFSKEVEMADINDATNQFIKAVSFIKKQLK